MPVDTTLKSTLNALVAGGAHNGINESLTITLPYIVFRQISGNPENGLLGYVGLTAYRYQVDVFSRTPEQARALALGTVKTAIVASSLAGLLIFSASGQYDGDDKSHQYITEYTIWATE
jgi:hypothetical protein